MVPTELCIKIVQLAADDEVHPSARTSFLASLRLVSTTFNEIAQRELFRAVVVDSPHQLSSLAAFYHGNRSGHAALVEELKVVWSDDSRKRAGAKEWRKAIRRLCALCPKLRRVTILGPRRSSGAFFCADWLDGAIHTLECLTLSRLSLASYPEVVAIRFPLVRSLSLTDCRPYALSQLPSFYSHFPDLTSLEIDNESIEPSLVEGALVLSPRPRFLSTLRSLSIPQAPFLRLFTPSRPASGSSEDSSSSSSDCREPKPESASSSSSSRPRHELDAPALAELTLTHVTFPVPLWDPFRQFVERYAPVPVARAHAHALADEARGGSRQGRVVGVRLVRAPGLDEL
ncbi:hypothetical protein JCM11491_006447 [Sporobolomyces phaffii]